MICIVFHINFSDKYFFNSVRCEKSKWPPLSSSVAITKLFWGFGKVGDILIRSVQPDFDLHCPQITSYL